MGKLPSKRRVPNAKTKRPHIKRSRGEVEIGDGVTVEGELPVVLLTVETHNARARHYFTSACANLAINAYAVDLLGWHPPLLYAHRTLYECVGAPKALEALVMQCPAVVSWQYAFSASVGGQAAGAGADKKRSMSRDAALTFSAMEEEHIVPPVCEKPHTPESYPKLVKPKRTYAPADSLARHDYRNSKRPALKPAEGMGLANDCPLVVGETFSTREQEMIAFLMSKHPSARLAW